jgi:hypothetical protein
MLLFLALYHFKCTQALPFTNESTVYSSPRSLASCDDIDNYRKLDEIIWSCITTIFACTWLTLHPNIPPPSDKKNSSFQQKCSLAIMRLIRHQLLPFIVALMAPEWILAWAMQQWVVANQIAKIGGEQFSPYYLGVYLHNIRERLDANTWLLCYHGWLSCLYTGQFRKSKP